MTWRFWRKECRRCVRLQRLLEAEKDKPRLADAELREHLRLAQEHARLASAALSKHADSALLSVLEGIAFDCGIEWKEMSRKYSEIEDAGKNTARDKAVAMIEFLAGHPEFRS